MSDNPSSPKDLLARYRRLSPNEAQQLTTLLAELTAAGLPLAEGFRAASEEASSRRLARALRSVAGQLEQGRSLADVLTDPRQPLPPHVAGLVTAGIRSGRLSTALTELFEQQRSAFELRRSALMAMAYPALVLSFLAAFYIFVGLAIVPQMRSIFEDFELKLPISTVAVLWAFGHGVWYLLAGAGFILTAAVLLRLFLPQANWQRIVATVPLVGPIWHWTGVAEAARLLSLLIEQHVPLPAALVLTGQGLSDANVAEVCGLLAVGVESGRSLGEQAAATHRLPPLLTTLVQWGEASGGLPEALLVAAETFENRTRRRIEALRVVLPPIVFLLVGGSAAFLVVGLVGPLLSLVAGLSRF